MALDLIVLASLFVFAWLGAHRGALESAIRLGGLGFAFVVSLLASAFGGVALAAATGMSGGIAVIVAGVLGFLLAQVLVGFIARSVRVEGDELSDASRVGGAALGMARAGFLLLPVLWLGGFTESLRASGLDQAGALPDLSTSRAAGAGQAAAGALAQSVVGDGGDMSARLTAKFIAEPGEAISSAVAITSDPRIQVLQRDFSFWGDLADENVESALARPTFRELVGDAELRERFAALGLVPPAAAVDAQMFHDELAAAFREIAPRLAELKHDPEFQALLADEELRERARSGDTVALLSDPRLRAVVERVSQ
jgi:uncharacterized membrane protein required for colicin V production